MDKLAAQRGLGDPRHRRDLRELITSTKLTISTCIFLLSYQDNYFKPQIVLDELKKIELTGEGILSEADFVLVASLISFITIDLKDDYDRDRFKLTISYLGIPHLSNIYFIIFVCTVKKVVIALMFRVFFCAAEKFVFETVMV